MENKFAFIMLSIVLSSCQFSANEKENSGEIKDQDLDLIKYVNPMIGTKNMGHTFPGATAPFGMVQLSPETNQQAYNIDGKYNPDT